MDKAIMLDRIKQHYNLQTDVNFAKFLGITPQVLSNWKSRNSFDAELIYKKCPDVNPSWLLCGAEPMVNASKETELQVNEEQSPYVLRKRLKYLEKEIEALLNADKIMSESGNQIKKAIQLLTDQLQSTEIELQTLLKEKK